MGRWKPAGLAPEGSSPGRATQTAVQGRRSEQFSDTGAPPAGSPEQTFQHFSLIVLVVELQMEQSVAAVYRSRALLSVTKYMWDRTRY